MPDEEIQLTRLADVSLSLSVSTQHTWRTFGLLILGYAVLIAATTPWARITGPEVPAMVAVLTTGVIVTELATVVLLLGQFSPAPSWRILLLSCAYLFSALMGVVHVLTFPGAVVPNRSVIGHPELTSAMFNAWRLGFAGWVVAAMLTPGRSAPDATPSWRFRRCVALMAPSVAVAALVLGTLPLGNIVSRMTVGGQFAGVGLLASWSAFLLGLAALALLVRECVRTGELIYLWLTLALATFCGDLFIGTLSGGRFTLGWYVGRVSGFVSAWTLLLFFLVQFAAQQRRIAADARELRESTRSLQREMARRSEAEQRLIQIQKVEAMGQLTGGIAHDFNNLLAAVIGNLELLRRRATLEPKATRWLDNALAAAERGTRLTSQLLVFSRTRRLDLVPVALSTVIAGVRELLTRTLGPRVSVCFQLDPADVPVMSEPTQLELALLNLALNARDAMPHGGSLTISTTSCRIESSLDLQPGDYVRLSVADTGVGMTAEVVARAFDPFYSTKEVGKGTGLGLSQVFGLARTGRGTATIDSRPSEGTTVHMFLRVADTSPSPPAQISRQDEAHVSGGRALIIDDDDDVRAVLIDLLTDLGWDTAHAASGPTGLAMLDQVKPDVVVVDFAMPELNGAEVARRARIACPDLPIILITGYADMAEINGMIDAGTVLLHKPFTRQDLQVTLGRVSLAQRST